MKTGDQSNPKGNGREIQPKHRIEGGSVMNSRLANIEHSRGIGEGGTPYEREWLHDSQVRDS